MIISNSKFYKNKRAYYKCKCDSCGACFERRSDYRNYDFCLKCSNKERGKRVRVHGDNNTNSRLHVTWANMKRRCLNPTPKEKRNYQDKGITVCDDWLEYINFRNWAMSNGYTDKLCIDRIDNTKGYSPDNCRFVSVSVNNANKGITNKNKSGFIGVIYYKGKYEAYIHWNKKKYYLGRHTSAIEASKARNKFIDENNLPHTKN